MILSAAVVLGLAQVCAQPIPQQLVLADAQKESGLDPLAIHDNKTKTSAHPRNLAEYLTIADTALRAGHRVDLGLMQIDSDNFDLLHLTPLSAADSCKSMKAAAQLLTMFSRYNTGQVNARGLVYARDVVDSSRAATVNDHDSPPVAPPLSPPPTPAINPFMSPAPTGREMVFTLRGEQTR